MTEPCRVNAPDARQSYTKATLIEALQTYQAEETARLAILFFLKNSDNSYSRENLDGHITASAWIVDEAYMQTLLVHHRKLNRWMQPGGHCDGDEDVFAGALREVVEETGLGTVDARFPIFDVDAHAIPARGDEPAHIHYDIRFLMIADRNAPVLVSAESHDVKWFPLESIRDDANLSDNVRRLARKVAAQ